MLGAARRDSGAPVRNLFCVDGTIPQTPLSRLISSASSGGGGRGGQVRLKLLISLLWVCAKAPHSVTRPARAWAALIGLSDPDTRGARRVREAFDQLESEGFIAVDRRDGHTPVVTIKSETGDGSDYTTPADAYSALKASSAPRPTLDRHLYFKIPSTFWTTGLIQNLDGPALSMLLIIFAESRGSTREVWFSPSKAAKSYGLAPSTQSKGLKALRELGLVKTTKKPISQSGKYIDVSRMRNVHRLTFP